ncbi:MAG: hypothetical protein IPG05_00510 [Gemmatimonadetes bacterium]|nr:hypothetical protein [Gemmatimonadota bacterium]
MTTHAPALALAVLLAGCSLSAKDAALATAKIDTLPGGIIQVTNSGPTKWADTSGWRLVLEREIVPEEGSPGEIGNPRTVVAGEDGTIYLLQQAPTMIKVYGADGQWLRNIGREGNGPGEFRDGMFGIARDTLFVQDPNNARFTTFTTNGTFITTKGSQCCWWTSRFPVFGDGTVGIIGQLPDTTKGSDGGGGAYYITRMDGSVIDTIRLKSTPPDPNDNWVITRKQGDNTSMMSMGIPLRPAHESAWLPDRHKVTGSTADYTLSVLTTKDDTVRRFSAPAPTVSITEAQRDSIFEAEVAGVGEQWEKSVREIAKPSQLPTTWPKWSGIAVDRASRIWVARPGAKGAASVLDVFTSDGILLGSVPAPDPKILEGFWTSSRVYLKDENAEGLPRIRVFRIDTTGTAGR